ncbi:MAG TPA: branched-chain amino acid ABC transporter permease [Acidimicrobiales bacterium]|nr:branched-chain amino acid ABC transporter permease [Acidimicrobiales bacterium]
MLQRKNLWWPLALAAFVVFPLIVSNPTYTTIGVFTLIFMGCTTSWNMFSGYSGYIALGSGVWYGVGAYTMALFSIHMNMAAGAAMFWLVPLGGLFAMIVAIPVGVVVLRVRRHTFVVITIAVFFVAQLSAINAGFTGGTAGLNLPFITWGASYYNVPFYYVALVIVIFITVLSAAVRRTRFGLQLLAIRDDEDRALGLGVKVSAVKLTGFAMSAFTVGMMGALYAMFIGQIYPQFVFDPLFDISIALMAFLGGLGTLVGPLLGALVLESLQQYLTVSYSNGSLYLILFGALFLIVILFMPQGVVVAIRDRVTKKAEREREAVTSNEAALLGGVNQ